MNTETPPEWTKGPVRRPVDMSDTFKQEGWEHCRVLITDPRSDLYRGSTVKVPNWQHHSKKEAKRTLKPQALRQAKARRRHLIKSLLKTSETPRRFYNIWIPNETHGSSARNQVTTSEVACY